MIIPQITYPFFSLVLVSRIYSNCLFLLLSTPTSTDSGSAGSNKSPYFHPDHFSLEPLCFLGSLSSSFNTHYLSLHGLWALGQKDGPLFPLLPLPAPFPIEKWPGSRPAAERVCAAPSPLVPAHWGPQNQCK